MINILHLYYDLLNLYGDNANIRAFKKEFERNHIKVKVDFKSLYEEIDFKKYDIIFIGSGSEENILLAIEDIKHRKEEILKYLNQDKYMFLTGNAIDIFSKNIIIGEHIIEGSNIFDFNSKYIDSQTFKNASRNRIVGECIASTNLIKEKIIGFQNRGTINLNIKENTLFKTSQNYSNNAKDLNEGFQYKNLYATHIIGPLFIRNPYLLDYFIEKILIEKKLKFTSNEKSAAKIAYKKYLESLN